MRPARLDEAVHVVQFAQMLLQALESGDQLPRPNVSACEGLEQIAPA
jgi:hypothetical protein